MPSHETGDAGMTFRTSCIHCDTLLEPGTGYWHLYGCRERARRVLARLEPPLDFEHQHGILSVRVRPARLPFSISHGTVRPRP